MDSAKKRWYGPKQLGIMLFTGICFLIAASVMGGNNNTVFPILAEVRGWNVSILNIVSGIACMIEAVGVLIFSRTIKKVGPRIMIGIALLATAGLLIVFGSATNIAVFSVTILIIGFIGAIYDKAGSMILTANWWPNLKGVVLGFSTIGVCCMNIVYVPLMPKLLNGLGITKGMMVVALIVAVVGVICLLFVRNTPEEAGEYPDGDPIYATEKGAEMGRLMKEYKSPFTAKKLLTDKNVWLLGIAALLAYMAAMSFISSTVPNLIGMGYSPVLGTTVFAVGGIVSFPGSAIFGVIDQKFGTKKAFIIFLVCMVISYIFALFMDRSAVFVWLAGIITFAANASLCNLVPSYVATKYGRWDYAAAYQVIGTLFTFGCGLGLMIPGFIHNPKTLYGFDLVVLVVALVFAFIINDKFVGKKDEIHE